MFKNNFVNWFHLTTGSVLWSFMCAVPWMWEFLTSEWNIRHFPWMQVVEFNYESYWGYVSFSCSCMVLGCYVNCSKKNNWFWGRLLNLWAMECTSFSSCFVLMAAIINLTEPTDIIKCYAFSHKYNVAVFVLPHMLEIQLNLWTPLLWDKTLRHFLIGWLKEISSFQRDTHRRRVPGTHRRYKKRDGDAQRIVITTDVFPRSLYRTCVLDGSLGFNTLICLYSATQLYVLPFNCDPCLRVILVIQTFTSSTLPFCLDFITFLLLMANCQRQLSFHWRFQSQIQLVRAFCTHRNFSLSL